MPIRIKGLHFINTVPFMDKVLALMKPFMKKELIDVMTLNTTIEPFLKYVPRKMLPTECGGTGDVSYKALTGNYLNVILNIFSYF